MRRLGKYIRGIWAIALQPLLISIWICAIALPSWSQFSPADPPINYSTQNTTEILLVHSIILLAPIGLILWLRQLALQSPKYDATATWFNYMSSLNWVIWAMWGLWLSANIALNTNGFIDFVLGEGISLTSLWAIKFSLFILPPAVVVVACNALSYPVYAKIRGMHYSQKDLIWQAVLGQTFSCIPIILCGTGIVAFFASEARLGVGAIASAFGCLIVLAPLVRKANDMTSHTLTVGELRDRIFALADLAGVKLQQIYVIPANKGRLANAFASSGNNILLTDYLLQKLSKQEVDAVVGHELGHLKLQHPQKLSRVLTITSGVFGGILGIMQGWQFMPIGIALSLLIYYFVSQQFEYAADAESVAIAKYPEAMITGLVKLMHLNMMPLQSGKQISTHPSTLDRAQAIAKRANISPDRLQEIISDLDRDRTEHYTLPPSFGNEEPIFSTNFKTNLVTRNVWIGIGVMTLTPALIALLTQQVDNSAKTFIYLVGIFVTLALYLVIADFFNGWGYADLQRQLSLRLLRQGLNVKNAQFVSFAPASQPRIYEYFYDWDIGFLFIGSVSKGSSQQNCLCYIGEQTRFTLYPEQVSDIKLGLGHPSWWKNAYVYITWYDKEQNTAGTFNLHPSAQHSIGRSQDEKAVRELNQQLKAWWEGRVELEIPDFLTQLGTPNIGTVTSRSIKDVLKSSNFLSRIQIPVIVAIAVNILFGLPFAASCYVVLVAILAIAFAMIPLWRYREHQ